MKVDSVTIFLKLRYMQTLLRESVFDSFSSTKISLLKFTKVYIPYPSGFDLLTFKKETLAINH